VQGHDHLPDDAEPLDLTSMPLSTDKPEPIICFGPLPQPSVFPQSHGQAAACMLHHNASHAHSTQPWGAQVETGIIPKLRCAPSGMDLPHLQLVWGAWTYLSSPVRAGTSTVLLSDFKNIMRKRLIWPCSFDTTSKEPQNPF